MIRLYNSRTRSKEYFEPLVPDKVKMYVCGPTVYNRVHIGNARPAVVFDTLYRLLSREFDEVIYARNITDIDDKIIKAAKDNGESIEALTERYTSAYQEDMAALSNLEPTISPLATDHISDMINMTETLIRKEHAYVSEKHVLFSVKSMADYGKLSNRSLDDMLAGARVEVAAYKKYAGDFILWKPAEENEPGWDSPWGRGRPGWHLECSAMVERHLGETIDIHGGGRDLIFPHHENEIAQSQCAHDGKIFSNYWMHNGYINIDGEKMSKSLGNFRLVHDLLEHYPGEVLRYALLSAHYRSELNFSVDLLDQARASLNTLYGFLRQVRNLETKSDAHLPGGFLTALHDDLNTPIALGELHRLAKQMNLAEENARGELKSQLLKSAELLGLLQADPDQWFQGSDIENDLTVTEIENLIEERKQAKKSGEYARADQLREQLLDLGIALEDSRDGTSWKRV